MQEASKQLKVLQQELQAFVSEGQAQRQKLEEAEARCVLCLGGGGLGLQFAVAVCCSCCHASQRTPWLWYYGLLSSPPPSFATPTCRREALEARCLELEASSQALAEQLAAAQEEREALSTQRAALEAQLGEARLHVAQLEQQQETFASVQQVGWTVQLRCVSRCRATQLAVQAVWFFSVCAHDSMCLPV